jgi:putative FmdB family regulatory protein
VPLYEYECKKCKHRFEKIRKFSDPPLKKCPECGGPIEQMISAPAVQFKGTGWYVTDYAAKSPAKEPGSSGKNESAEKAESHEKAEKVDKPEKEEKKHAPADKNSSSEEKPKRNESRKPRR